MATRTLQLGSSLNGSIRSEMDINDANWRPSKLRVINESDRGYEIIVRNAGVVVFTQVVPAGQTQEWGINGIQLGWQEDYWNSITEQYEPSGIDMGSYTIQMRTV